MKKEVVGLEIQNKRELHLWRWFFSLVFIAALATAGWYAYRWYSTGEEPPIPLPVASANPAIDESHISKTEIDNYTVPATQPRYISIPKLHINKARVTKVGVTANNMLDVPKNIGDTAWYEKSAHPGQGYGAVLINGHNGGIRRDGVFAKLSTLLKGDNITVERGDGKKVTYAVEESENMTIDEVNTTGMKKMMKPIYADKEGLSLITCDGKWIPKEKQFDRRIMLRAVQK